MNTISPNRAHPVTRLLAGAILIGGCLVTHHGTTTGLVALPAVALLSLLLNRVRVSAMARLLLAGSAFYLPIVLLASPGIAMKGLSAAVVGMATVSSLGPQGLHDGILRLPLPAVVRLLLLQMIHQTEVLRRETLRIHQAIAVRGGTHGLRGYWEFAKSLPVVWLPRVVFRAERVGMAMDLREYGAVMPRAGTLRWGSSDLALFTGSLFIASAALYCSGLASV